MKLFTAMESFVDSKEYDYDEFTMVREQIDTESIEVDKSIEIYIDTMVALENLKELESYKVTNRGVYNITMEALSYQFGFPEGTQVTCEGIGKTISEFAVKVWEKIKAAWLIITNWGRKLLGYAPKLSEEEQARRDQAIKDILKEDDSLVKAAMDGAENLERDLESIVGDMFRESRDESSKKQEQQQEIEAEQEEQEKEPEVIVERTQKQIDAANRVQALMAMDRIMNNMLPQAEDALDEYGNDIDFEEHDYNVVTMKGDKTDAFYAGVHKVINEYEKKLEAEVKATDSREVQEKLEYYTNVTKHMFLVKFAAHVNGWATVTLPHVSAMPNQYLLDRTNEVSKFIRNPRNRTKAGTVVLLTNTLHVSASNGGTAYFEIPETLSETVPCSSHHPNEYVRNGDVVTPWLERVVLGNTMLVKSLKPEHFRDPDNLVRLAKVLRGEALFINSRYEVMLQEKNITVSLSNEIMYRKYINDIPALKRKIFRRV